MYSDQLDSSDIEVLVEALKAWEQKDLASSMMGTLLTGILSSQKSSDMSDWEKREQEREAKREREVKLRQERSIMLQAKLFALRNQLTTDNLVSEALGR